MPKLPSVHMKYIENIVIGRPLVPAWTLLAQTARDWIENEKEKTIFTEERFLPKILVDLGVVKSTSEVKRNKPELFKTLDKPDFLEIKWGKRKLWILAGGI